MKSETSDIRHTEGDASAEVVLPVIGGKVIDEMAWGAASGLN